MMHGRNLEIMEDIFNNIFAKNRVMSITGKPVGVCYRLPSNTKERAVIEASKDLTTLGGSRRLYKGDLPPDSQKKENFDYYLNPTLRYYDLPVILRAIIFYFAPNPLT